LLARTCALAVLLLVALAPQGAAALIIHPAETITHEVRVQVVHVRDDAGANPAPLLGTALQQAGIEAFIDAIWAQAGIDIVFESSVTTWDDTWALEGTPGNNAPRPTSDLSAMMLAASGDSVLSADPFTLNMFFVDVVPGFSQNGSNTVNGLAFVGGNGSAVWVGPGLPTFGTGREAVASVLAHEIGHNLGLGHIVEDWNLLQSSGQPNQGEQLNAAQIVAALASPFATALPEPAAVALLAMAALAFDALRRRRAPRPR